MQNATVITLPARIVRALRQSLPATAAGPEIELALQDARMDAGTGTHTVAIPSGLVLTVRGLLHDTEQQMSKEEPEHRMRVYRRLFDKAAQRLLAA
jgi:hypothetical protein